MDKVMDKIMVIIPVEGITTTLSTALTMTTTTTLEATVEVTMAEVMEDRTVRLLPPASAEGWVLSMRRYLPVMLQQDRMGKNSQI